MAIGTLFEVPASSESLFAKARYKSEWYEAMEEACVGSAPQLHAEDSLPAWEYSLSRTNRTAAVANFFIGDMQSGDEDAGGPSVVFHGPTSVQAIATELAGHGAQFFEDLLTEHGHEPDKWLFEPMLKFFTRAAARGSSVVVLWGN